MRFLGSDVGKRMLEAGNIRREFRFSLLSPAERYFPGGGGDEVMLQGVVDCFFEEGGALTVIDFKTDRVTRDTLDEKAGYYAPQLLAYSEALERITGKPVKSRIIYFFAVNRIRLDDKLVEPHYRYYALLPCQLAHGRERVVPETAHDACRLHLCDAAKRFR
jgi:hypothetical protein